MIAGIKKGKDTRIEQGEAPALREAYSLIEHLTIETKRLISGRANPGSSESDLVSVCVCKEECSCIKSNVSKNNMITEIKDNKITNIKEKVMNDI